MLTDIQIADIRDVVMVHAPAILAAHTLVKGSVYACDDGDVVLLSKGKDYVMTSPKMMGTWMSDSETGPVTIKTQGIEYFDFDTQFVSKRITKIADHRRVVKTSLHVFEAAADSESFPDHTDPVDVIMVVLDGTKVIHVTEGPVVTRHELHKGDVLYVPANRVHRAENTHGSIMVSVGLEPYTLDHIEREG